MEIDQFIVRTDKKDHETIDDHLTIGVPKEMRAKIMALPKKQRCDLYDSVRKFMSHLEKIYSSEMS